MSAHSSPQLGVLCVDHFDSFVFNLVDEFERRSCVTRTIRSDSSFGAALETLESLPPKRLILLSPGPGRPAESGVGLDLIRHLLGRIPFFGVCLGFQALVEQFGGRVTPGDATIHGKSSPIDHSGDGLFRDTPDGALPNPMPVARYHSLIAQNLPPTLEVTARLNGDPRIPMAIENRVLGAFGVQFHPESILTPHGGKLIQNVIELALRHASVSRRTASTSADRRPPRSSGRRTIVEPSGNLGRVR